MNVLACAIRTMKMGMRGLGKAARSAGITGHREITKPLLRIPLTGHDTEDCKPNEAQIPGIKRVR